MEQWEHGGGFSLDASVRIEARDRRGLERLLRDCARPPFAADRLEELDAQRLIDHLPKLGPDGRTPLILSPLELIRRIAARVPPPRQHQHRYYGVLAPNPPLAQRSPPWRQPEQGGEEDERHESGDDADHQAVEQERPHGAARGRLPPGWGGLDQPFNFSVSKSLTCCGLALPWDSFITCPTKKPNSLSLPA
jgi:hypothetical protein